MYPGRYWYRTEINSGSFTTLLSFPPVSASHSRVERGRDECPAAKLPPVCCSTDPKNKTVSLMGQNDTVKWR
jgi:hypothetical protein